MAEHWKPITGHDGYEVSDLGRVRSIPRKVGVRGGGTRITPTCILKPWWVSNDRHKKGHLAVSLGRGHRYKVHHLVLEAFEGPRPPGRLGLHRDGNPANNCHSNLYWGTYEDNLHDAVRHGTHHSASKTHCSKDHPLDGVWGNGKRYCTTCRREYLRDYKKRKREGGPINPPGRPKKATIDSAEEASTLPRAEGPDPRDS